jgi:hypothetical protein
MEREGGHTLTEQKAGFDFEVLRRALEQSEAETLLSLYADDAEIKTINRNATPSSPQVLSGKEEIGEILRDVCSRQMTHRIEDEVIG